MKAPNVQHRLLTGIIRPGKRISNIASSTPNKMTKTIASLGPAAQLIDSSIFETIGVSKFILNVFSRGGLLPLIYFSGYLNRGNFFFFMYLGKSSTDLMGF